MHPVVSLFCLLFLVLSDARCALYSSVSGDPVEDKSLNRVVRSGTPCNEEAMVYLAPSMSLDRR